MNCEWVVIEHHPNDSRERICEDGIFQTLSSRMGTGGGNVPMVIRISNDSVQEDNSPGS